MVEKLPLDFVQKIYNMLTNGNDDVNFYCMCIQNQNREAATNSPVKFALNLIKINILCRLPFFKRKLFSEKIGETYLSRIFVRPEICELASGMLDNSVLITDIFDCVVTTIKDKDHIFMDIENKIKVKNFARLRKKYDSSNLPIKVIYEKINSKLKTSIDYNIELSIMESQYIPNKYGARLLDIATCNNIYVTAIVRSGYPREFIIFLNEQNRHIYFDGVHTDVFRHIRPIFIDISHRDGSTTREVIYLYSNDEKILSTAEKFQQIKELKHTGITLDIHSISQSDREKIRVLEGVLEATEARLKEYIAHKKG